ncbi:MAG: hypothetical protein GQF41_3742 [Candidatus Rifleibacterium amylolyticum]|nr:MAG: hypothetical protein GQF41_3742 [Candidatus Rifleibacterium amylolyticum]
MALYRLATVSRRREGAFLKLTALFGLATPEKAFKTTADLTLCFSHSIRNSDQTCFSLVVLFFRECFWQGRGFLVFWLQ